MNNDLRLFTHVYVDNHAPHTLFLFHGTGGDEYDLLPLARSVAPTYNYLSFRGNSHEQGQNRFFKRFSSGVFDQQSILTEVTKLHNFLVSWHASHPAHVLDVFLGYSNGANMILATLFMYPQLINNMVLLHPMLPSKPPIPSQSFATKHAFLSYGINDPIITLAESQLVIHALQSLKINLNLYESPGGHEVSQSEVNSIRGQFNILKQK